MVSIFITFLVILASTVDVSVRKYFRFTIVKKQTKPKFSIFEIFLTFPKKLVFFSLCAIFFTKIIFLKSLFRTETKPCKPLQKSGVYFRFKRYNFE